MLIEFIKQLLNDFMVKKTFFAFFIIFSIFSITFSQVGMKIFENNITIRNSETYSKLRIYGSNESLIEIFYREVGINEIISTQIKNLVQNLSEQKDYVKLEFFQNYLKLQNINNERISFSDIVFLIKKLENAEPGYRVFFIGAKELKEVQNQTDYSVAIIPIVEVPLIVYVDGIAIRKIDILDVDVTYEDKPKINIIVKNVGTVTTSFKINLNISDLVFSSYEILKPKETKIIKFPVSIVGRYNLSVFIDYYSDYTLFEKEIEIKEVLITTEKISKILINVFPYLLVIMSLFIALIIIKKRRE